MNIIDIITLNKHGDFQEVIFSSLMSYLLNPLSDHGLNHVLLKKIVGEAFSDMEASWLESAEVKAECSLGAEGRVDICVEMAKKILAIEVKIWDQSARNVSKAGAPQVERYCDYLSKKHAREDWRFIYLIPTFDSPKCLSEFEKACSKGYGDNVKLMAWNPPNEESLIADKLSKDAYIEKSMLNMLNEILENKEVKRVDIPLNTQWLLDSLCEFIPNLLLKVPDSAKFPIKRDLEQNPDTWKLFNIFFTVARRWPSPILTTVGVPYGTGTNKAKLHGNSLYRIRTTTDYYSRKEDKEKHLPTDKVELELWPDVYDKVSGNLLDWLEKLGLSKHAISEGKHIDGKKNVPTVVVSINRNVRLSDEHASDFNAIMRSGFDKIMKALETSD